MPGTHRWAAALFLAVGAAGCASFLPAPLPMRAVEAPRGSAPARCLLVLLPGLGDRAETFGSRGFPERIRRGGIDAEVVAADATIGYYAQGHMPGRLHADVIAPRARAGQRVWLLGISMGGMGSLMTGRDHPVAGLVLLAPYLGDRSLTEEIAAAGGLARWQPGPIAGPLASETYQRQVWGWLQQAVAADQPKIVLGFGNDDKSIQQHRVLAAALPADRVRHAPGGHDWDAWTKLLDDVLERSPLVEECAGGTGLR